MRDTGVGYGKKKKKDAVSKIAAAVRPDDRAGPRGAPKKIGHTAPQVIAQAAKRHPDPVLTPERRRQARTAASIPRQVERMGPIDILGDLDKVGKYTIGLGMSAPSRWPGNALGAVGIHTGLPQDKPQITTIRGRKAELSLGMLPWGVGGAKAARAELKVHPARKSFHENIDKSVTDKQVAARMKQTYDREVLKAAKKAGVRPGEYLDKLKQSEAARKVTTGLTSERAQTLRRDQEALYHEERVKRVQAGEQAMQQSPGLAGHQAAKQALKGSLPKLQFHGLNGLTDDEMESLVAHVQQSSALRFFDKIKASEALRAAREESVVPTNNERLLLRKAFGPEYEQELFNSSSGAEKFFNLLNIPRTLQSTLDVSYLFRQNLVGFLRHPVISGKNIRPSLRYLRSEKEYQAGRRALEADPLYEEGKSVGLALTDLEHSLGNREEAYQSSYAEKFTGGEHSPVRMSGRAFTGFSADERLDLYRHYRELAEKQGYELNKKGLRDLAGFINDTTGRGHLKGFERSAVAMNSLFFSPRLIASRFSFLNPVSYARLDPFVRRQKVRAALHLFGGMVSFLWLADQVPGVDVGVDPTSGDFGKIRVGNTRIDIAGGFSQYVRLAGTLGLAAMGKDDNGKAWDSVVRFGRGKLSPNASIITDFVTHTNYAGFPVKDWKKEVYDNFIPLVLQDIRDVYNQTDSLPATVAAAAAAAVGIGVQSYGDKAKAKKAPTPRESLVKDLQDYPVPEQYRHQFMQALDAREALGERKKLEKARLGKPLSHKQEAAIVLDLVFHYRPDAEPYRAQLVAQLNKATDVEAKRQLLPRWKRALGFGKLDHYKTVVNKRRDAELEQIQKREMGK